LLLLCISVTVPDALPDFAQVYRCRLGGARLIAELRQLLLLGFFAFGVVFVVCFRLLNNVFTLLIRPVFAAGAGCLLVLDMVDFLFRWLVAGAPNCLYVRTDETFTLRMSRCET
jgi:hypothetical protein